MIPQMTVSCDITELNGEDLPLQHLLHPALLHQLPPVPLLAPQPQPVQHPLVLVRLPAHQEQPVLQLLQLVPVLQLPVPVRPVPAVQHRHQPVHQPVLVHQLVLQQRYNYEQHTF